MTQTQDLTKEELLQEIAVLKSTLTNLATQNANQSITIASLQTQLQVLSNANGDDEQE